jgi:hypothetical protein
MAQIGDRHSDGRIYAGPDYGYQSPASYKQLEKQGAFKLGASAIRRTKQAISSRLPQQVKDAAKWYGESGQRANQRLKDRGFTQEQIDERRTIEAKHSKSGDATQQLLSQVSDALNVAPEIVQGVTAIAETAISGRLAASATKRTLQNVATKAPAPVAHAMGPDKRRDLIRQQVRKRVEQDRVAPKQTTAKEMESTTKWIRNKDGTYTLQPREDILEQTAKGVRPSERKWSQKPVDPASRYPKEVTDPNTHQTIEVRSRLPYKNRSGGLDTYSSTAKGKQPGTSRGDGPERRIQSPKETTPPETFLDIEDVKTSDMARPKSDGKSLDAALDPRSRGRVDRKGKPMPSHAQIRKDRLDSARAKAVEEKITARTKQLNTEEIRQQVWYADSDYTKLEKIAADLGIESSKHKTPSELERAINKRLNKTDVLYGGKPTLTKPERKAVDDKFDRQNLTGATQSERKRLSELATQDFGEGQPGRRPLKDMGRQMPEADPKNYRDTNEVRGRKNAYGTKDAEPSFDSGKRSKLEDRTAKKDHQWYLDNFEFDEVTGQFKLDENGAYIPKKGKRFDYSKPQRDKPIPDEVAGESVQDLIRKRLGY